MKLLQRAIFFMGCFIFIYLLFTSKPKSITIESNSKSDSTTGCEHLNGYPKIQYAIVIDAGSTGSRVHIYRFNYCTHSPALEDEVLVATKPGLSSYTDPKLASASLDILLKAAIDSVPKELYACTPITLQATAGLRMLGGDLSTQILNEIHNHLSSDYPFPIFEIDGISIMGGDKEGIFAWITVNYLLGNIGSSSRKKTAGIMDLGGGSTQIVFEPATPIEDGVHRVEIDFSNHKYFLYQHSYDGYGLMQGRQKIMQAAVPDKQSPCLPEHQQIEFIVDTVSHTIAGLANDITQCQSLIKNQLFSKDTCLLNPCSFDGIYMPPIVQSFHHDLYAFSYFFDKFARPFKEDGKFTVGSIKNAASKVCKPRPDVHIDGVKELEKNKEWCIDLNFMYSLLSIGYSIPDDRELLSAKKLNGIELGWSLGSAIKMLDHQLNNPKFSGCRT